MDHPAEQKERSQKEQAGKNKVKAPQKSGDGGGEGGFEGMGDALVVADKGRRAGEGEFDAFGISTSRPLV